LIDHNHPLVVEINSRFDVPHSRFNDVSQTAMEQVGIRVLASSEVGVHLAVSPDGFRIVYFQGHPEYDDISLLKEYKREVMRFFNQQRQDYPPFPLHYFDEQAQAVFFKYKQQVIAASQQQQPLPEFPEAQVIPYLDNTWRDTAKAVFNNWLGKVYQITNEDRRLPFMAGVNPNNPLALK
jgi:homoserine O-succinyltransferase